MPEGKHFYEFGPFRLDPAERLLLCNSQTVPLAPKAFDTLLLLVENSGHLLSKDELIKRLWPETFVEEVNLAQNISTIRRAFDGKNGGEQYIETVPKGGYRFTAETRKVFHEPPKTAAPGPNSAAAPVSEPVLGRWSVAYLAVSALATILVIACVLFFTSTSDEVPSEGSAAHPRHDCDTFYCCLAPRESLFRSLTGVFL